MKRLMTATAVKLWRENWSGELRDYHQEMELARGQVIIEKLEAIRKLYMDGKCEESPVLGLAIMLLHDPEAIEITELPK